MSIFSYSQHFLNAIIAENFNIIPYEREKRNTNNHPISKLRKQTTLTGFTRAESHHLTVCTKYS